MARRVDYVELVRLRNLGIQYSEIAGRLGVQRKQCGACDR